MTRSARQIAVASLAALAAVAAIVAADITPPASAQSGDESTGRIVARLLEDGRVEFGWQPTGGARVFPRDDRYLTPLTDIWEGWFVSGPVEVGGTAIGWINVRRVKGLRFEFAFTTTGGELIKPRALPPNLRARRSLVPQHRDHDRPTHRADRVSAAQVPARLDCASRTARLACAATAHRDRSSR